MISKIFLDTYVIIYALINHIIIMQSFYYSNLGVGNGGDGISMGRHQSTRLHAERGTWNCCWSVYYI